MADTVPEDQVQDVLDEFYGDQSPAGLIFVKRLISRFVEKSPLEAARWIASLSDDNFGHEAYRQFIVSWAKEDLAAALGWIQQQPKSGNKTVAELSLAQEAAEANNGVTAISLIAGLPSSPERDSLLNYSVRQWATTDRTNAIAWIEQVPDPALREQMLENVAVDMGRQDPADAATFAGAVLQPGEGKNSAVIDIVRLWATSDPEQAASWVEKIPEGQLPDAAVENLIEVWTNVTPSAAIIWLNQLPPGHLRELAEQIVGTGLSAGSSN